MTEADRVAELANRRGAEPGQRTSPLPNEVESRLSPRVADRDLPRDRHYSGPEHAYQPERYSGFSPLRDQLRASANLPQERAAPSANAFAQPYLNANPYGSAREALPPSRTVESPRTSHRGGRADRQGSQGYYPDGVPPPPVPRFGGDAFQYPPPFAPMSPRASRPDARSGSARPAPSQPPRLQTPVGQPYLALEQTVGTMRNIPQQMTEFRLMRRRSSHSLVDALMDDLETREDAWFAQNDAYSAQQVEDRRRDQGRRDAEQTRREDEERRSRRGRGRRSSWSDDDEQQHGWR